MKKKKEVKWVIIKIQSFSYKDIVKKMVKQATGWEIICKPHIW